MLPSFTYSQTHLVPWGPGDASYVPFGDSAAAYVSTIAQTVVRAFQTALWADRYSGSSSITQGEEVGYVYNDPILPVGSQGPVLTYPGVFTPRPHTTGTVVPTVGAPVFEPGSIFGPGGGMGPLPPDAYDPPSADTRPGEAPIYDEYEGEVNVATWTDIISGAVDIWQGQVPGGGALLPTAFAPPSTAIPAGNGAPPAKVTVDTRTGAVTPCRRRRRRRLLTSTDINDLAALKAIVGGGQAMNLAVAKAVRR